MSHRNPSEARKAWQDAKTKHKDLLKQKKIEFKEEFGPTMEKAEKLAKEGKDKECIVELGKLTKIEQSYKTLLFTKAGLKPGEGAGKDFAEAFHKIGLYISEATKDVG